MSVSGSPGTLGELRTDFCFEAEVGGVHTARMKMLPELATLLAAAPKDAKRDDFNRLILAESILSKRITSNCWLLARHLADLYCLDHAAAVFRLLRYFWGVDAPIRPMLALVCAHARDALLNNHWTKD